jgi:predicted DNA binding CopG/RHH family protein
MAFSPYASLIGEHLSESLGLDIGEKVNVSMNAKRKYTDGPIGEVEVLDDFLPSPEELAFKEDTVKVTISLSRSSIEFFKEEASKHDTAYQKMIRRLLDSYVDRHTGT